MSSAEAFFTPVNIIVILQKTCYNYVIPDRTKGPGLFKALRSKLSNPHTRKNPQERTPYDRTKRGIVMIVHTHAFVWWTVDKIRTRLHQTIEPIAAKHGVAIAAEADRALEYCLHDHNLVLVTYELVDNDAEVGPMLKELNVALYEILRKPGKGLEGFEGHPKLLNAEAILDVPPNLGFDPVRALGVGLVMMAQDNADRQQNEQPVQS